MSQIRHQTDRLHTASGSLGTMREAVLRTSTGLSHGVAPALRGDYPESAAVAAQYRALRARMTTSADVLGTGSAGLRRFALACAAVETRNAALLDGVTRSRKAGRARTSSTRGSSSPGRGLARFLGVLPPEDPNGLEVAAWFLDLRKTVLQAVVTWATTVTYGRFAPRDARGRYTQLTTKEEIRAAAEDKRNWQAKKGHGETRRAWIELSESKGVRALDRIGGVLSFASTAKEQWDADAGKYDDDVRALRAGTVAASEQAGSKVGFGAGFAAGAAFGAPFGPVGVVIGGGIGGFVGSEAGARAGKAVGKVIIDAPENAAKAVQAAKNKAQDVKDDVAHAARVAKDRVGDTAGDVKDVATDAAKKLDDARDSVSDGVKAAGGKAKDVAGDVKDGIGGGAKAAGSKLKDAGGKLKGLFP